jgi:WD40 repeat protein/transcriptional regulator with XRE-family HTH domain
VKRSSHSERDYAFGQAMLTLRTNIGLTQAELANRLNISSRAVAEWEAGSSYPKVERLKLLIVLGIQHQAFATGHEAAEIHALWKVSHQKVLLDELWLQGLLGTQRPPLVLVTSQPVEEMRSGESTLPKPAPGPRLDWGDAFDISSFYNRQEETSTLAQWLVQERCKVVSVLGMGGIGKSSLAVSLMHQVAPHFEVVLWRSLRDAPSCEKLLEDCLQIIAPQPLADIPASLEGRLSLLLEHFRGERALLVLDNLETVLEEGESTGRTRPSYEGYAQLLRRVAQTEHQSCLLLTSREKPSELVPLEGSRTPVRTLRLAGLDAMAGERLLMEKDVSGNTSERARLIDRYGGNPLALKIVAQTIVELFGNEIAPFLDQGEVVFGSIRELLAEQFDRLSVVEQTVLLWLAILREPVSIAELLAVLGTPLAGGQVLDAMEALRRRSLLERGKRSGSFTLQSVVLEYVTTRFIVDAAREIEQGSLTRLIEHSVELATSKEYVRQTQTYLIVIPLLMQLRTVYRRHAEVEAHLITLLDQLRERADYAQGYGPTNLLTLLREQRGHLRGLDLSQLVIRAASLQGVEMQDTTLAGATLRDTTFTGAFDDIWALTISRNGTFWAMSGRQGKVQVWQQEGKLLYLAWQAHIDTIMALTFSPDERTLITGGWDGSLKLWSLEHGALLWTVWHIDSVNIAVFAPTGDMVASGGNDGVVRLWDATSGTTRQTLTGHAGPVFALAWSPDGKLLASGGFDGVIRLWDLSVPEPSVHIFTGHTAWVSGLAFAPNGRILASASWDKTVKLWDMQSLDMRQTLTGHTNWVFRLAWSPDGKLLASCGPERTIWLWDIEKNSYRAALHGHSAVVHDLAFTSENRTLISGSEDGTLRIWDVESGQCVRIVQGYAVSLYDIDWSPDGTHLASASSDLLVTIWDSVGRTPPMQLVGHQLNIHGVTWSPDGGFMASCGEDNAIRVWDTKTGITVRILQDTDHGDTIFRCVAWSPDGQRLAGGSFQQGVLVWDVTTGTRQWVGRTEALLRIGWIAWSPDSTCLASGGDDGSVFLWDGFAGTLQRRFVGHRGMVMDVAWSLDGMRLASGGGDKGQGELFVWDMQSGERLYTLNEPSEVVYALAWSPTGEVLVSGGSDGMLRWWDMHHGECIRIRKAHQGAVQSLKMNQDGRRLASCGNDGAINIWDMASGEHLHTLRRDRPYERVNISEVKGLTQAQRAALQTLGAHEVM